MRSRILLTVLVFGVALGVYWGTASWLGDGVTPRQAYFNHLADAFLHGRLYLEEPPSTHDLTFFQGQWYVPFPPLPALLMLPWVALFGVESVNTVFFSALFGALNVALIYLLLTAMTKRGWTHLITRDHLWLTVFFAFGSVHWYMATLGSVWFVAQICTVTFIALAVWLTIEHGSPWLAGGALALALLARPNVILTWPLLAGIAATVMLTQVTVSQMQPVPAFSWQAIKWRALLRWSLLSLIPLALAIGLLLLYNLARFGNPTDFGYLNENVADELAPNLHTYGQFNLHYLPKNFWAMWLAGPRWDREANFWLPDPEGMSLLLTSPVLIYLGRARRRLPLVWGGWVTLLLLMAPLLLYYNTGWWQFGYRFSLDFIVPAVFLIAVAAGTRVTWAMRWLILAGVLSNLYGVLWWYGAF
ncbi:MAG: hypothetical protein R3C14_21965 [Caldilineaceae bacterium]